MTDPLMADLLEVELGRGMLVAPSELYLLRALASSLAAAAPDSTLRSKVGSLLRSTELRNSLVEQALALGAMMRGW